jgi:hypothetical protein
VKHPRIHKPTPCEHATSRAGPLYCETGITVGGSMAARAASCNAWQAAHLRVNARPGMVVSIA